MTDNPEILLFGHHVNRKDIEFLFYDLMVQFHLLKVMLCKAKIKKKCRIIRKSLADMTFKVTTEDSNNDFVGRNKCKAMELRRDSLKASFERVCVYT